jgi:hypothetical protein
MIFLVKLLSILMIVYGCLLILRPRILKKIVSYFSEGKRIYIAAGIKVIIGVILMIASSYCRIAWFVLFLGALAVLSSIAFFFLKKKIVDMFVEKLRNLRKRKVVVIGMASLALGVLLILSI